MKYREQAAVLNIEEIGKDIFSLVLQTKLIAKEAVPGQFVSVYSNDKSRLLPRPISICEADEESGCLRLVFRIAGEGTVGIHLSFDVDAITPEYAPGTGTPVNNGITAREAFLAVEMLAASGKLLSMDLVEVNPILDERNKTGNLASDLIQLALGKQVY